MEQDKMQTVLLMETMVEEADRVYRNLIGIISEEIGPSSPTGLGLFKARLHAAVFAAYGFVRRWPGQEEDGMELLNVASGVAIEALSRLDSAPSVSREQATAVGLEYLKEVFSAIKMEIKSGPSSPGNESEGFRKLTDLYHDAVRDSIGHRKYTAAVASRFDHLVAGSIVAGLRVATAA
jgi:hypothetical protein